MPVTGNEQWISRNFRILSLRGAGLSLTTHARVLLRTTHHLKGYACARSRRPWASPGAALITPPPTWPKLATFPNHEDDRTNRHQIQACRPLPGPCQPGTGGPTRLLRGHGRRRRPSRQFRPGSAPPANPGNRDLTAASPCGLASSRQPRVTARRDTCHLPTRLRCSPSAMTQARSGRCACYRPTCTVIKTVGLTAASPGSSRSPWAWSSSATPIVTRSVAADVRD